MSIIDFIAPIATTPDVVAVSTASGIYAPSLPQIRTPETPSDFDETVPAAKGARTRLTSQVQLLPVAAEELKVHAELYAKIMGEHAPRSPELAQRMLLTVAWLAEARRAKLWFRYVTAQAETAWNATMLGLEELRPLVDLAVRHEGAAMQLFPALLAILTARSKIAKKAASTRRAIKAGKPAKDAAARIAKAHARERAYPQGGEDGRRSFARLNAERAPLRAARSARGGHRIRALVQDRDIAVVPYPRTEVRGTMGCGTNQAHRCATGSIGKRVHAAPSTERKLVAIDGAGFAERWHCLEPVA